MNSKRLRIGIYAGTFDPVHAGHVTFALQAVQQAALDELHFLPERHPRHKQGVEHFGHRVAMLQRAIKPHPTFGVLELPELNLSVKRSLPRLQQQFPDDQLVLLFGSDVVKELTNWPNYQRLLETCELIIGLRANDDLRTIQKEIEAWPGSPTVTMFETFAPDISSRDIRAALLKRQPTKGLLSSVARYSNRHWLYVSLSN